MRNFLVSDVHGNYRALITALEEAGYDPSRSDHQLYDGGDAFGRADCTPEYSGSLSVYEYYRSPIHKNPPKCLYGNHYDILEKIRERNDYVGSDLYNKEHLTLASFGKVKPMETLFLSRDREEFKEFLDKIERETGLFSWIKSLPFYYDIGEKFRFFHGWQPDNNHKLAQNPLKIQRKRWISSSWCNTEDKINMFGYVYPDGWKRTLVFGHWSSWQLRNIWPDGNPDEYGIWQDKRLGLIGIDACTVLSKKVNVLIIEDNKILNKELQ